MLFCSFYRCCSRTTGISDRGRLLYFQKSSAVPPVPPDGCRVHRHTPRGKPCRFHDWESGLCLPSTGASCRFYLPRRRRHTEKRYGKIFLLCRPKSHCPEAEDRRPSRPPVEHEFRIRKEIVCRCFLIGQVRPVRHLSCGFSLVLNFYLPNSASNGDAGIPAPFTRFTSGDCAQP